MDISVVGAGRTGTALAVHWQRAGHRIVAVSGRDATRARSQTWLPATPVLDHAEAAALGEVVALGVPDDSIEEVCVSLARAGAFRKGASVMHFSGARGLDVLRTAADPGAEILSLHPLQTFPDVASAVERIPGSWMAVTAEAEGAFALGERLARDAGGEPFRLPDEMKPLYHAAAVFASNYLVTVLAEAEVLFRAAGLPEPREMFMPLARASLGNVENLGPEATLTGPAVRGDVGTIELNLKALAEKAPRAVPVYVALAEAALDLGSRSGRLPSEARARVERALSRWR